MSAKSTEPRTTQGTRKQNKKVNKSGNGIAKRGPLSAVEKGKQIMLHPPSNPVSIPDVASSFPKSVNIVTTEQGIQMQHLQQTEHEPSQFLFNVATPDNPPFVEPVFMNPPVPPDTVTASMDTEDQLPTKVDTLVIDAE